MNTNTKINFKNINKRTKSFVRTDEDHSSAGHVLVGKPCQHIYYILARYGFQTAFKYEDMDNHHDDCDDDDDDDDDVPCIQR